SPKFKLKQEFEEVKTKLNESPELLDGVEKKAKACATKYSILLEKDRENIKGALEDVDGAVKYYESQTPSEDYRAKLTTGGHSLSVTQYKYGTLFPQGREDSLFSIVCDLIEKTATPS